MISYISESTSIRAIMTISLPQFFDTISQISSTTNTDILLITSSEEEAVNYSKQLSFFVSDREVLYLPALDSLPYDRVSPSQKVISARAYVLSRLLVKQSNIILITSAPNLLCKFPDIEKNNSKFTLF